MTWLDLTWALMASASVVLGLIHLSVWSRQGERFDSLAFFVLAAASAGYGYFELQMMRALTPQAAAEAVRWGQVPLSIFVVGLAVFVRLHFGTGRVTLLAAIAALRVLALVLNFGTGVNVNFDEVVALQAVHLWDARVSVPIGHANRWTIVPQLSNLLLLVFVVDASWSLWRRGSREARHRALLVGGSVAACIVAAAMMAMFTVYGLATVPTILTPAFLIIVIAMSRELGDDLVHAALLSQALASSEVRLQAVIESVPSAILLVDAAGTIALVNAHAERTFGAARDRFIGQPVETLIPERLRGAHEKLRSTYADDPRPRAMGGRRELVARRADGSEFPVEVGLAPLQAGGSELVLVSLVDIGERLAAERDMAHQRAEVAHLSRVAMLGELSGSLAHEINQPLAAILSNAQAARRFLNRAPPELAQVADALDAIVNNDRRASTVIERLRALLRKGEMQLEVVDLNELVEDSLRLLASDLTRRGVEVRTELEPKLPAVRGDRVQLQQVLLNLIVNACDAMEGLPAPRPLVVRTAADAGARIEVADRGGGIAPADLERVFEPFFTTKARGLGIGLALCRTIVQAHGGRIGAADNPGGGARVTVELPPDRESAW